MIFGADLQDLVDLARHEEHGAPCSDVLRSALSAAIERRRGPDAPLAPALADLTIRREGLPQWWGRDNLLLASPGGDPALALGLVFGPRTGNVGVVGADTQVGGLVFPSRSSLIVIGDRVNMVLGEITAMDGGTVLLGEDSAAISWARVDARNGGAVVVGADAMWGAGVNLVTDDMHAIREVGSSRRTNRYGGRIVVERHVWLCNEVRLMAGAHVGADSVVGLGAVVRDVLPAGSVSVGSPARPIRQGVTWTREDLP